MKALLITLSLIFAASSFASIDSMRARVGKVAELKDKGMIGEQPDGYLGIVAANADAEAKAVVEAENNDRKEEYQKRAQSRGQKVEELSVVLGEARIREEKAGRYVRKKDGSWEKK